MRVKPFDTPSTMFATRTLASPWMPRERRESSMRVTLTTDPETAMASSRGSARESFRRGPSTRTVPSETCTFTPPGTEIGMRPTRDIALPHRTEQLAADALLARLAVHEDAFRRRQHVDAETAADGRDLAGSDVHAEARTRHPLDAGDDRTAALVVAQRDAERPLGRVAVDAGRALEVAFVDQHLGEGLLVARPRHVDGGLARLRTVADPGEHVGDGIGEHRPTSWPS